MDLTLSLPGSPPRVSTVNIAAGLMGRLPESLAPYLEGRSVYWIWDEQVWELWHQRVNSLRWPGLVEPRIIRFAASEANKRLAAVEHLARQLVQAGADRLGVVVAVGGGVTGDVVGFLASIYMRGIPHIQIPTTLLSQVDSSVGGKTGVDLPEGKNLLGTFQQAQTVCIDPTFLETLPAAEFRQGMAEVIKMALLADQQLWDYLEGHSAELQRLEVESLTHVIGTCCRLKADVVQADEKEAGYRRVLNLGHTVGHALERLSDYRVAHGDAVAMGLVSAARLALCMGLIPEAVVQRLEKLCAAWNLPVRIPAEFSPEAIVAALKTDKKQLAGKLHFILPVRIGAVVERHDLDLEMLRRVLQEQQRG
jgi:3-dehydroquinate synthase